MQHHVYFWLKEEHKNATDKEKFQKGMQLCVDIPSVKSGNWGVQAATAERPVTDKTWDYALCCSFDSVADHDAYQVHPLHDEFLDHCKGMWEKVVIMDVE